MAPLEIEIHPGEHPTRQFLGLTFNIDTIWVTVVAGLIVISHGFWARAKLTEKTDDHVPTKIQLVWETVVSQVNTYSHRIPNENIKDNLNMRKKKKPKKHVRDKEFGKIR